MSTVALDHLPDRFDAYGVDLMRYRVGSIYVYRATLNKWIRDELIEEVGEPGRNRAFQKTARGRLVRDGDSSSA